MALEDKKLKMDLLKAEAAKAELEFKIEERLIEIQRIKDHIALQEKRIEEVKAEITAREEQQ